MNGTDIHALFSHAMMARVLPEKQIREWFEGMAVREIANNINTTPSPTNNENAYMKSLVRFGGVGTAAGEVSSVNTYSLD